jgi:hypothetical protein
MMTAFSGLLRGRTNGAFVMVSSPVRRTGHDEDILRDEDEFIRDIIPILDTYFQG